MPNIPVINGGIEYVYGFQMYRTGNKTLSFTPGMARSSQNLTDIVVPGTFNVTTAILFDGTIVGPNGMDAAPLAASTSYYVFIIGDSTKNNSPAVLASGSQFTAKLPVGYDVFKRIGFIKTDASSNILVFNQYGCGIEREYWFDSPVAILTAGAATTFTVVSLGINNAPIPQNSFSGHCYLDIVYTPNVATDVAEFLPGGSLATTGNVRFGTGVAGAQVGQICVPFRTVGGTPQILYKVTAGDTLTLSLAGWTESLAE